MKKKALLIWVFMFMGSVSWVLAQTTATGTVNHPHPRITEVKSRMHNQMLRIRSGVKSGKLTKQQAQALLASLKGVKEQMEADFTANGKKELTDDQLGQLNQMLNENSKAIFGEKHETDASDSTGSSTSTGSTSTGSTGTSSTGTAPSN